MAERGLTGCGARAVLGSAVLVLLSCAVGNVLLAVTESVWWPLAVGVGWWGVAVGVAVQAEAATASGSAAPRAARPTVAPAVPARRA
ncbi:hypothetical protein [Lentzea flava]|uniref:Uncharacterized protein n=1 Tax=Lentzea flava TaxID=103732 RepID=A0ABQ2U9Y3_9PSEU|nr:hypothetical protein [Lentzea flava]MCP2196764.1 hypothetical protein [Lentzea flava]GGU15687.1 hypothetical protein GCM10010178_04060 [Lentzea flava]